LTAGTAKISGIGVVTSYALVSSADTRTSLGLDGTHVPAITMVSASTIGVGLMSVCEATEEEVVAAEQWLVNERSKIFKLAQQKQTNNTTTSPRGLIHLEAVYVVGWSTVAHGRFIDLTNG
jgi:hypothetical protein